MSMLDAPFPKPYGVPDYSKDVPSERAVGQYYPGEKWKDLFHGFWFRYIYCCHGMPGWLAETPKGVLDIADFLGKYTGEDEDSYRLRLEGVYHEFFSEESYHSFRNTYCGIAFPCMKTYLEWALQEGMKVNSG